MPDDRILRVKAALPISKVAARYVELGRRRGADVFALCPFHPEKTPSFKINDRTGRYHCFGCGADGDAIDLVQKLENVEFREALRILSDMAGVDAPENFAKPVDALRRERDARRKEREQEALAREAAAAEAAKAVVAGCGTGEHPYFESKGFAERIGLIADCGGPPWLAGVAENSNAWRAGRGGGPWLVLPIRDARNEIRSAQYVAPDGTKKFHLGSSTRACYHRIGRSAKSVVLCEGYATGLSVHDALAKRYYPCEVRVCFSAQNIAAVAKKCKAPDAWIVADNDRNGVGREWALKTGLPHWIPPIGGRDANDLMNEQGAQRLADLLQKFRRERQQGF